jgi:phage repressor protein C with HTH and peptisase S24 domain
MNSETPIKLRLAKLIGKEKPFVWAKKVGLSAATFNRVWNLGGQLKSAQLELIHQKTGASLNWLIAGEGPMLEKERMSVQAEEAMEDDYVLIPVMQGRISAGGGLVPDNTCEMKCAFQKEWITRKGDHKKMSMIRVLGDSMAPTLLDGDMVLVNHGITTVAAGGGIYAITFQDEIIVKRIDVLFPSGQWQVRSDNPDYPSFTVEPSQVVINGKIIWFARALER